MRRRANTNKQLQAISTSLHRNLNRVDMKLQSYFVIFKPSNSQNVHEMPPELAMNRTR